MPWDFPGGPVVKNLPSNAGDAGSIPGWGTKIPHAEGQLTPCATTTDLSASTREPACHKVQSPDTLEPARHSYRDHLLWSPHATTREEKTPTPQLERSSRAPVKSLCISRKDPACLNEDPTCCN